MTTCRNFEGGPIPWIAISDFARDNKLTWLRDTFEEIILSLDLEMMMLEAAKRKPPKPKGLRK